LNALYVSSCRFLLSASATTSELSGIGHQFDLSDHPLMRCGIPRWDTWAPSGMLQNYDHHRYTAHGVRIVQRGHMAEFHFPPACAPIKMLRRVSHLPGINNHVSCQCPLVSYGQCIPAVAKHVFLGPRCILMRERECAYSPGDRADELNKKPLLGILVVDELEPPRYSRISESAPLLPLLPGPGYCSGW
jgi:hypothetical protein